MNGSRRGKTPGGPPGFRNFCRIVRKRNRRVAPGRIGPARGDPSTMPRSTQVAQTDAPNDPLRNTLARPAWFAHDFTRKSFGRLQA